MHRRILAVALCALATVVRAENTYTLRYFGVRGLAETIRLFLADVDAKFDVSFVLDLCASPGC